MELKIPVLASQAGIVVGGVVFTLVSKTGQASTYVIEQGTSLTALALGATMELVAGPVAGVVTHKIVANAGESYVVPAAKASANTTAIVAGAVAGMATTLIMSASIYGSKFIVKKIQEHHEKSKPKVQVEDPLASYELKEEGEFMTLLLPDDPALLKDTVEK
jgi:hypothetical protein